MFLVEPDLGFFGDPVIVSLLCIEDLSCQPPGQTAEFLDFIEDFFQFDGRQPEFARQTD